MYNIHIIFMLTCDWFKSGRNDQRELKRENDMGFKERYESRRVVEYDPTDGPSSKRSRNHSRGREPSPRRDREPKRSWKRERNLPRAHTPDRRTYKRQDSKEGRRERRGQTYKPRSSRRRTARVAWAVGRLVPLWSRSRKP